jgi:hypothetical protein
MSPHHLAARVQPAVVALGQGDELLGVRAQLLRLHERGADALALEERGGEVAQQGDAVGRHTAQLAVRDPMSHVASGPRCFRTLLNPPAFHARARCGGYWLCVCG